MYEIIVIGNDLSSLMAALRSSQSGKKTILLNDIDIPDYYTASGYTFDTDPLPWTGFESEGIFSKILSDLELSADTIPMTPLFQMIFPDHRYDILKNTTEQIKEIERETGRNTIDLVNFYETILKANTLMSVLISENPRVRPGTVKELLKFMPNFPGIMSMKRRFSRQFARVQTHPLLKAAFCAQLLLFSHLNPEGISPLSFAYILSLPFRGLNYPVGGKYRIVDSLKRKIESTGGIVKNCSAIHLKVDSDEAMVDISGGNENCITIKGRHAIVSTKWKGFLPFLLENGRRFSSILDKFDKIKTTHHPFTLHLGISAESVPEKLSPYSVLFSGDELPLERDIFQENFLFLELSLPGDRGRAPDGRRALSITALLKDSPSDLSNKELTEASINMIKGIERLLPFLNEAVDFIDIERSIDISRRSQGFINQRYLQKQNPMLGVSLLSDRTPLNNLSITGGVLLAGLGMEGEIISGLNAANIFNGDGSYV